ncbi:UDP-galactopyranose mutase [Cloacibacillus evryensis]|nr:UDP-galactopyranose mutase [Cloacibacillus evryensis]EHL65004.1 UDP-galactopyranose mutase [Synergistes sp. 3_1_syn1]
MNEYKYDYLIVGGGLFGCTYARELSNHGKKCLIIESRSHLGGNIYCTKKDDIIVHTYGAHIFHTSNSYIWEFVNKYTNFNNYINSPIANYKGELYNLPFNMNTFNKMWGVVTPEEALDKINEQKLKLNRPPKNLEEQALSLVGKDIYNKLIKGYTEKQWGRDCKNLPSFIIKRLPLRFTYDNNYYNDRFQGIPYLGYNELINNLTKDIEIRCNVNYYDSREYFDHISKKILFTGPIDEYFNYCYGALEYRGLDFKNELYENSNFQGVAVMNYTDKETPYTRVIEHKHFNFGTQPISYITKEFPCIWKRGDNAYYPVNDEKNQILYNQYKQLADNNAKVIFGGRLGLYRYYDMDKTIEAALDMASTEYKYFNTQQD